MARRRGPAGERDGEVHDFLPAASLLTPGVDAMGRAAAAVLRGDAGAGGFAHSLTITFEPAATAIARPAFGNPNSYAWAVPLLGQTWNATVDVGSTGHLFAIVFASTSPGNLSLGPGFTVLLGGPMAEFLPIAAGPQAAYALALPANATLAGFQLSTQALHFGGASSLLLSNAQDLTLGF